MSIPLKQPPRQSLVGNIEEQLRSALLSGRLRPGQRLKIRDLAKQLGTSPTPVREALIRLVAAGGLTAAPAQAFQVPTLTKRDYMEICRIRQAVEGLAAEQAAMRATPADIERLAKLAREFLDAKRRGDAVEALDRNKRFRYALYALADMPRLLAIIEGLWLRIGPCFNYLYPQPPIRIEGHHNYEELIAAMRDGRVGAVRSAIECAILDGAELLLPLLPEGDETAPEPQAATSATLALP